MCQGEKAIHKIRPSESLPADVIHEIGRAQSRAADAIHEISQKKFLAAGLLHDISQTKSLAAGLIHEIGRAQSRAASVIHRIRNFESRETALFFAVYLTFFCPEHQRNREISDFTLVKCFVLDRHATNIEKFRGFVKRSEYFLVIFCIFSLDITEKQQILPSGIVYVLCF